MLHKFHGGLKLRHHKAESLSNGLRDLPLASELFLSLRTAKGVLLTPHCEVGDDVLKGQVVAQNRQSGVCLHAPTSGKIIELAEKHTPFFNSPRANVMVLQADFEEKWIEKPAPKPIESFTKQELLDLMKNYGLKGLGGAGFATHIKYQTQKPIETLIVNGAECEPYISCDEQLMRNYPQELIKGIVLMLKVSDTQKAIIAIEDTLGGVKSLLDEKIQELGINSIEVVKIPTIYPTGGERQLIEVLTGLEVPSGGIPADLGLLVQNPGTIKAMYDAVYEQKPLLERIITVAGDAVDRSCNFVVPLGTPLEHLLKHADCDFHRLEKLVIGGPMMGFSMPNTDIGVDKTTNCVLAIGKENTLNSTTSPANEMPCIRCGECVEACPAELLPQQLHWYIQGGNLEKAREHHLFDCIECGACSYVCPSQINLVDYYKFAKSELTYLDYKKRKSEESQQRHENREKRLLRLKELRASKRRRTTKRTQDPNKAQKDLQATLARVNQKVNQKAQQESDINNADS